MRTKYKKWANDLLIERQELSPTNIDDNLFKHDKIILEIGSGKGDYLYKMALRFPSYYFIGVEKNSTCAGITLKKIIDNDVKNAIIISKDINEIILDIKKSSIDGIILNFSDPWPKKRHHKRRLTSNNLLDIYYDILKKDGFLNFKTDNELLFEDSIKYFNNSKFKIKKIDYDYQFDPSFDEITDYESYFRNLNQKIYRLEVVKE